MPIAVEGHYGVLIDHFARQEALYVVTVGMSHGGSAYHLLTQVKDHIRIH